MEWIAKWIKPAQPMDPVAPIFTKIFSVRGRPLKAVLYLTALGTYEATVNGIRISDYVLAPGWTSYLNRLQYQTYDITALLQQNNCLQVLVGAGWYRSRIPAWPAAKNEILRKFPVGMIAQLELDYADGTKEIIPSDQSWYADESCIRFSDIFDGEICDGRVQLGFSGKTVEFDGPSHTLIPQEGPPVREQERFAVARMFTTPKGELVIDFGQEITGYVQTCLVASSGEELSLSFAEVMDAEGNFYTENYRSAKCQYRYICRDGFQIYKPKTTFWGFRYIRIDAFPGGMEKVDAACFTAIAVYSEMKRTGYLQCSDPLLNRLFSNILWGQRCNYLDIPTDCPQRDERLGWTGDAQVFIRTACLNYDVEQFFAKWLGDMRADQYPDGRISHCIPDPGVGHDAPCASAAWADAATICPWELYLAYGNKELLREQFDMMCKHVDHITNTTTTKNLWTGGRHFGDWLALDASEGSARGGSREDFIASAFYAHSTLLVVKAGRVLGQDVSEYEVLYDQIVETFRKVYPDYRTQTEYVLALQFDLAQQPQATADALARMIQEGGGYLKTGFVGTPYLLHVLSRYGHGELAYSLLLRQQYPSWLYQVTKGATTVWEHWDCIREDGSLQDPGMTSFNHYAYGAVADWVYSVAAGINRVEEAPGYRQVRIAPLPDPRLDWLSAEFNSRHGKIRSCWQKEEDFWRYEITVPVQAEIVIDQKVHHVDAGTYYFYSPITSER